MKIHKLLLFFIAFPVLGLGQEIITLPNQNSSGLSWEGEAYEFYFNDWKTEVITNVSGAHLEVFTADPMVANGTSVIIAPGGGLLAHSIEKEGRRVARWLNQKGITAFVLQYRLLPMGKDGMSKMPKDEEKIIELVSNVLPLSIEDGKNAVTYVRENAQRWDLDQKKIGFMGFSAGGAITMGVALGSDENQIPDFIVPVYPWMKVIGEYMIPEEVPPMLVICASDDPLMIGPDSITLYSRWIDEGGLAGLHMYSKGGHGFGMEKQGLPSDNWIDRFYEWAVTENFVESKNPY
ncbi:MAG: alpha/beta hydrolase [Flavobacteriaceae bacterium]